MEPIKLHWLQPTPAWLGMPVDPSHAWHEFIIVVHGHYKVRRAGRMDQGGPGQVFFIPAGQEHEPDLKVDGSLQFAMITCQPGKPVDDDFAQQVEDRLGRLCSIATWMRSYESQTGREQQRCLRNLLNVFADEYRRLSRGDAGGQDLVARALAYMRHGLKQNFGIADICDALDVSGSTLHRLFQERTGRSAMDHLGAIRAETALQLIRETRLPVREVAERIGLAHHASVGRLLKKHFGKSIRELRQT